MSDLYRKLGLVQRPNLKQELLTASEIGVCLGLSKEQVRHLLRRKVIPAVKIGRKWMIPVKEFERIIHNVTKCEAQLEAE